LLIAAGPVVTVEKPERFSAPAFPSSGGNHQEKVAEGLLCRFPRLRQFPQASFLSVLLLFSFFVKNSKFPQKFPRQDRL
jgi:hypothetical protein